MRIGIFGGTFNPPHVGHLIVAEAVREHLGMDKVVFVPSYINPQKQESEVASGDHRLEMLRLATDGNPGFVVSDAEIRRGGVSFTVDTLAEFHRTYPVADLYFLVGIDNLPAFNTWRDPERILSLARVAVMTRPGFSAVESPLMKDERVTLCVVPDIGISSTDIRERVRTGRSIRYLVPSPVEEFIKSEGIYR